MDAAKPLLQAAVVALLATMGAQTLAQTAARPKLRITAPSNITRDVPSVGAPFGPVPTAANFNGEVVFTLDEGGKSSNDGCEPIQSDVKGKIALVVRGTCDFIVKAQNAEAAGASAVVIINNVAGPLPSISGEGLVNIPVLLVSQADGNLMARNESSVRLGTSVAGRMALL